MTLELRLIHPMAILRQLSLLSNSLKLAQPMRWWLTQFQLKLAISIPVTPLILAVGRRDRVTVESFQGGTAQNVTLGLVDAANATVAISGNVATQAIDDDTQRSATTMLTGSITVIQDLSILW